MLTMVRATIALISLLAVNLAGAKLVEEYDWIEVKTDNFVVYSLLSERQTLMTARHLELLRAAIPAHVLPWNQDKPVPDTVFLLRGTWQINDLGYDRDTWYYADHEHGEFILIGTHTYAFTAVDTAYLRFLIGSKSTYQSFLWYEEGLVRLFRDSKIRDGKFIFGNYFAQVASKKSVDWLFSGMDHSTLSNDRFWGLYSTSLSIVRMLIDDDYEQQTFGDRLRAYVGMTERGVDPRKAFESAFRISVEDLDDELDDYALHRCCRAFAFPLESLLPEFNYEIRPLKRAEVALGLGHVASRLGERDEARRLFTRATANDTTRAGALAGLEELNQKRSAEKCPDCDKNSFESVDSKNLENRGIQ